MRLAFLASHPIQYQAPLFRALAARPGVELEVLFCDVHGVVPTFDRGFSQTVQYDVPLLEGYHHRFLKNRSPRPGPPQNLFNPEIVPLMRAGGYDALVMHGYSSPTQVLALLTPLRGRLRVLVRGESYLLQRSRTDLLMRQLGLRALFTRVDHFLAIGSLNAAFYRAYGVNSDRITLAPYTVDNAYFRERAAVATRESARFRRELGIPEDAVAFVYCGKLIDAKRPLDAVRAFATSCAGRDACLVMVGNGALDAEVRAEVERLGITGQVRMLGFRNQSELPAIYGCCNALVLPSEHENWGLVVNEAMACGLAVAVSSHVGAAADLVKENGFVFEVGDTRGLAAGLAGWVADRARLEREREASRRNIAAWDIGQTVDGILAGVRVALDARA